MEGSICIVFSLKENVKIMFVEVWLFGRDSEDLLDPRKSTNFQGTNKTATSLYRWDVAGSCSWAAAPCRMDVVTC